MRTPTDRLGHGGERGSILVITLAVLVLVGAFAATVATMVSNSTESNALQRLGNQAFYMAESGARYAIAKLRKDAMDAVDDLDGKTFTFRDGAGFELAVTGTDGGAVWRFFIDSTGFVGSGDGQNIQRQALNGYYIEIPKYDDYVTLPTAFTFAVQTPIPSTTTLSGSSYIDSYDSAVGDWTSVGAGSAAVIRSAGTEDVLKLSGSSYIYGSVSVPVGTDTSDYDSLIRAPNYDHASQMPVVAAAEAPGIDTVAVPTEPAEAAMPTSWDPVPSFPNWGSSIIPAGSYATSGSLSTGSAGLTATGDLALDIGKDLSLSGSSLTVEGDLSAWIDRDAKVTTWGTGLSVSGNADLEVGRNFDVSGGQVVVNGDLDLDVDGDFSISGGGSLHVTGDAYIDVGGSFSISGGGSLVVDGNVTIHVADGFSLSGGTSPIVIGENASLQIYVDGGKITFSSPSTNVGNTPAQFLVFGGAGVTDVSLNGSATVVGAIHAPSADLSINGSSQLFGAVVASSVKLNGSSSIHYDEALSRVMPNIDLTEYPLRNYWVVVGTN